MTAAEVALEAARLGLIGTITVGVLATMGTLAGTLVAPFLIRRSEAKAKFAQQRHDDLAEVIPLLISKGTMGAIPGASVVAMAESLEAHARFGVLLGPKEWQMAAIAREALLAHDAGPAAMKASGTATALIPMWARGEISSAQAAAIYERDTGTKITRPTPPVTEPESKRRRLRKGPTY